MILSTVRARLVWVVFCGGYISGDLVILSDVFDGLVRAVSCAESLDEASPLPPQPDATRAYANAVASNVLLFISCHQNIFLAVIQRGVPHDLQESSCNHYILTPCCKAWLLCEGRSKAFQVSDNITAIYLENSGPGALVVYEM